MLFIGAEKAMPPENGGVTGNRTGGMTGSLMRWESGGSGPFATHWSQAQARVMNIRKWLAIALFLSEILILISDKNMGKHAQSIDHQVLRRMRSQRKDRAFTPADFLDLGSRASIDQALSRNARSGIIRKVGRGLYDVPQDHPVLGRLSTTTDAVVNAVAKRTSATLLPSGAHAANQLGLSDQVPMRPVYLTDGRRRRLQVGKISVLLKPAAPRTIHTKHPTSALVIHALRWIGRKHVDDETIAKLRCNLKPEVRAALVADAPHAPGWIADIFHQLAKDSSS